MQILQFPDSSWGLTVLKNIFLRFIGLNGLQMVWKKSSLIWNFFPWFWLKTPGFSLISLTGKSLQNFPWIPWSVGTLVQWWGGGGRVYLPLILPPLWVYLPPPWIPTRGYTPWVYIHPGYLPLGTANPPSREMVPGIPTPPPLPCQ